MKTQKVTIYIRLCGEPGRPFEKVKVRKPRQCGEHDHYCLRVGGNWEFFAEGDPARTNLNAVLRRQFEREQELRLGMTAPSIPLAKPDKPGKTPVADAVQKYFDSLEATGKDPKTIRNYRVALDGFVASYKKPYIEDYERQDLIDYMGWLRRQPRRERKHANPDRTYFNKVSHVATFLKACGVRPELKASEYPRYHENRVVAHTDDELATLYREADEDERFLLDFLIGTMVRGGEAPMVKYSDLSGTTLTVHGKQYKTRRVEITERLALAIRKRGEAAMKRGGPKLLFPNCNGRPNTHLLGDLQKLAERARAKFHTGLHKLRKTGASRRYRAGEPVMILMEELGHESLSTTERFLSDVKPEGAKQAVEAADFIPSGTLTEGAAAAACGHVRQRRGTAPVKQAPKRRSPRARLSPRKRSRKIRATPR